MKLFGTREDRLKRLGILASMQGVIGLIMLAAIVVFLLGFCSSPP